MDIEFKRCPEIRLTLDGGAVVSSEFNAGFFPCPLARRDFSDPRLFCARNADLPRSVVAGPLETVGFGGQLGENVLPVSLSLQRANHRRSFSPEVLMFDYPFRVPRALCLINPARGAARRALLLPAFESQASESIRVALSLRGPPALAGGHQPSVPRKLWSLFDNQGRLNCSGSKAPWPWSKQDGGERECFAVVGAGPAPAGLVPVGDSLRHGAWPDAW